MNDIARLAQIYEGYGGLSVDYPKSTSNLRSPTYDRKNSFMPHGIASSGGADNAYAANMMNSGALEEEETNPAAMKLYDFCEELRDRGYDSVANELKLLVKEVLG